MLRGWFQMSTVDLMNGILQNLPSFKCPKHLHSPRSKKIWAAKSNSCVQTWLSTDQAWIVMDHNRCHGKFAVVGRLARLSARRSPSWICTWGVSNTSQMPLRADAIPGYQLLQFRTCLVLYKVFFISPRSQWASTILIAKPATLLTLRWPRNIWSGYNWLTNTTRH